jgi:hypothetical protein
VGCISHAVESSRKAWREKGGRSIQMPKKAFCTEYRIQMNKGKGGNFYARIYYKCRNNHSIFALTDKFISQNLLLVQGRQTSRTTCKITSKLIGYLIDGYERREI